ncbi:methyl-accepting chemotaxis protein [Nautilia profundicola AmH]|uniref:Methyl-accepting chemotaxis protein n=1 Tax=Nautilia profundicola (strain ATCC BAA-1463 / DSM 18972 / AmH) TaxID=598659 RepID=B9L9U4_NAUPA|nr:HD domain-containing phosphohydrolase [Nautilia profundicola]ACM92726.1 methyl-accepting chemotaxis protein [Nautilia profundicola AmH]
MLNHELISQIEQSKKDFDKLMDKLIRNLKREEKILLLSDKRQKKEYDELERKFEEVKKLQKEQQELIDSFIKMIASAIDAKNEYIGAHCERVPILTILLAKEVSKDDSIDFEIKNKDEEKEISTAAWLHDSGKIVTPDFVMDKAVKLETLYNRIHEIRARFEIVYRDLIIEAQQRKLNGEDEKEVDEWLKKELDKLQEEFKFVAEMNHGYAEVNDEKIEKLKKIAKRTWLRHFDDTLGLSKEELKRISEEEKNQKLPVKEYLLADKKRHVIKRSKKEIEELKRNGFKIKIPENLYNFGEIYNLSIKRGTLTPEEYYKIQEHVIMTIKMLESLPFPEKFKNVPLYAGAHHETLNGKGYPRKLKGDEIPIPARIMAIADIFEALTANDRPYKKRKKLSEAIDILVEKALHNELDKQILIVFLKSKLYKKYAEMFLAKDQIDEIDEEYYIKLLKKGN